MKKKMILILLVLLCTTGCTSLYELSKEYSSVSTRTSRNKRTYIFDGIEISNIKAKEHYITGKIKNTNYYDCESINIDIVLKKDGKKVTGFLLIDDSLDSYETSSFDEIFVEDDYGELGSHYNLSTYDIHVTGATCYKY